MRVVANTHSDPTAREIATFCGDVLERTDNPRDLTEYLNHRALRAFGDAT